MFESVNDRYDVSLPNGWPVHPTPVDCERCGGRIHQMSLRADSWCSACLSGSNHTLGRASWRWRTAA